MKTFEWFVGSFAVAMFLVAAAAAPSQAVVPPPEPKTTNTCQPSGTVNPPPGNCACATGYCSDGTINWTCTKTTKLVIKPGGGFDELCACGC